MPSSRPSPQQNEARALKVYGWTRGGQLRCIVAARSWREAARAVGDQSMASMRNYGAITANEREISVAMSQPGVVFARHTTRFSAPFLPLARGGSS